MAVFRENEAIDRGFEAAKRILIPHEGTIEERNEALRVLENLVSELGPVVEGYPVWHPFLTMQKSTGPQDVPNRDCGYEGLDHTVFFTNGFVTCPYNGVEKVTTSVEKISRNIGGVASLSTEIIDAPLYSKNTDTIVVRCIWNDDLDSGRFIPKRTAIGLMLDHEIPHWHRSEVAETWERMSGYLLGHPHGARSSLFVSQETGMAMKKVWTVLSESGVFGPFLENTMRKQS